MLFVKKASSFLPIPQGHPFLPLCSSKPVRVGENESGIRGEQGQGRWDKWAAAAPELLVPQHPGSDPCSNWQTEVSQGHHVAEGFPLGTGTTIYFLALSRVESGLGEKPVVLPLAPQRKALGSSTRFICNWEKVEVGMK